MLGCTSNRPPDRLLQAGPLFTQLSDSCCNRLSGPSTDRLDFIGCLGWTHIISTYKTSWLAAAESGKEQAPFPSRVAGVWVMSWASLVDDRKTGRRSVERAGCSIDVGEAGIASDHSREDSLHDLQLHRHHVVWIDR